MSLSFHFFPPSPFSSFSFFFFLFSAFFLPFFPLFADFGREGREWEKYTNDGSIDGEIGSIRLTSTLTSTMTICNILSYTEYLLSRPDLHQQYPLNVPIFLSFHLMETRSLFQIIFIKHFTMIIKRTKYLRNVYFRWKKY